MIDFCLLLLLTASQIAVCFRTAVLPGEYPLANLIYDFDIFFLEIGTAPCDIGAVDLVLVCVRLFTTKNGDRLLVCIVCLMMRDLYRVLVLCALCSEEGFFLGVEVWKEDITNGGLFLTSLALVDWIFVLCSILL